MRLPRRFRLARVAAIGLALLIAGCASSRPRILDETKVEEWGRCAHAQPNFTVVCLQLRPPM
jgi:hypothetical protein